MSSVDGGWSDSIPLCPWPPIYAAAVFLISFIEFFISDLLVSLSRVSLRSSTLSEAR